MLKLLKTSGYSHIIAADRSSAGGEAQHGASRARCRARGASCACAPSQAQAGCDGCRESCISAWLGCTTSSETTGSEASLMMALQCAI